jgi:hypothetical protein
MSGRPILKSQPLIHETPCPSPFPITYGKAGEIITAIIEKQLGCYSSPLASIIEPQTKAVRETGPQRNGIIHTLVLP